MSPITHLLLGWSLASTTPGLQRRERAIVALASVVADLDGLGIVIDAATKTTSLYADYHHALGHNLAFGVATTGLAIIFAPRKLMVGALAFLSFHLHLLGDLLGSRGPDGYQWPIPYLQPFSSMWQWTWDGQWQLNAWPNFLLTGILLLLTFKLARDRGYSPIEIVSSRADQIFVDAIRARFPLQPEL